MAAAAAADAVDGAPLALFALLCLLNAASWLLARSRTGFLQQQKARLTQEIAALRRQAEALNTPATYAKCAKLQRLANAKEKELAALQQDAAKPHPAAAAAPASAASAARGIGSSSSGGGSTTSSNSGLLAALLPGRAAGAAGGGLQERADALLSLLKVLVVALAAVAWWGKALLFVPPHLTWPFGRLLAFPHAGPAHIELGAVTVLPWLAVCDRVTQLLARVAFPEPQLHLRTRPLAPVAEEPSHLAE